MAETAPERTHPEKCGAERPPSGAPAASSGVPGGSAEEGGGLSSKEAHSSAAAEAASRGAGPWPSSTASHAADGGGGLLAGAESSREEGEEEGEEGEEEGKEEVGVEVENVGSVENVELESERAQPVSHPSLLSRERAASAPGSLSHAATRKEEENGFEEEEAEQEGNETESVVPATSAVGVDGETSPSSTKGATADAGTRTRQGPPFEGNSKPLHVTVVAPPSVTASGQPSPRAWRASGPRATTSAVAGNKRSAGEDDDGARISFFFFFFFPAFPSLFLFRFRVSLRSGYKRRVACF